jgi:trans-2,3-dihydro-3-hydroxyanthranilate isomerase
MQYSFLTADVFTNAKFSGNPVAIFPDGSGLTTEQMQAVATEFNLSETAFIRPPERGGDHTLRIFTPRTEIPFAGHPTIGAAHVLRWIGYQPKKVVFEEQAGDVPVTFSGKRATLVSPQYPKEYGSPVRSDEVAPILELQTENVINVTGFSAGTPYLLVELKLASHVSEARLDLSRWRQALSKSASPDIYIFSLEQFEEEIIPARMFAPAFGIMEDPATGSAAAALGGYLKQRYGNCSVRVDQGREIGRPSQLFLEVDETVRVGGESVKVSEGSIDV